MSLDNKDIELSEDNVKIHTKECDEKVFDKNKRKCMADIKRGVNVSRMRLEKYELEDYYDEYKKNIPVLVSKKEFVEIVNKEYELFIKGVNILINNNKDDMTVEIWELLNKYNMESLFNNKDKYDLISSIIDSMSYKEFMESDEDDNEDEKEDNKDEDIDDSIIEDDKTRRCIEDDKTRRCFKLGNIFKKILNNQDLNIDEKVIAQGIQPYEMAVYYQDKSILFKLDEEINKIKNENITPAGSEKTLNHIHSTIKKLLNNENLFLRINLLPYLGLSRCPYLYLRSIVFFRKILKEN